jgi:hypothetical protein
MVLSICHSGFPDLRFPILSINGKMIHSPSQGFPGLFISAAFCREMEIGGKRREIWKRGRLAS